MGPFITEQDSPCWTAGLMPCMTQRIQWKFKPVMLKLNNLLTKDTSISLLLPEHYLPGWFSTHLHNKSLTMDLILQKIPWSIMC